LATDVALHGVAHARLTDFTVSKFLKVAAEVQAVNFTLQLN
jgi:hypothetical protein